MVFIVKQEGNEVYRIIRLSPRAEMTDQCRIQDVINPKVCFDNLEFRKPIYRAIISKMIANGINIKEVNGGETTNELHNRIIKYFNDSSIKIYFVELPKAVFPFTTIMDELQDLGL